MAARTRPVLSCKKRRLVRPSTIMPLSKKVSWEFFALVFLVNMEKNNRKEEQDSRASKAVGKTKEKRRRRL